MSTFDNVADRYKNKALVQQKAAAKLLSLLALEGRENVLDVACGPGHVTSLLASATAGSVVGTDISEGMIRQARACYPASGFRCIAAAGLDYVAAFDAVFCNSSFQWFTKPHEALAAMHRALKRGGRLALACPATTRWSPWFTALMPHVIANPAVAPVFNHWRNPWFFLPDQAAYAALFAAAGFTTVAIETAYEAALYEPDKAYDIYLSGAANGFANKAYYDIPVTDEYLALFHRLVREEIERAAVDGKVTVDFTRLYYLGKK